MTVYGRLLKVYRGHRGLSLRVFCVEADLDPVLVSKIERGVTPPPGAALQRALEDALELDASERRRLRHAAREGAATFQPPSEEDALRMLPVFTYPYRRMTRGDVERLLKVLRE